MNDDYDIDFLAEHRPRPDAPSQTDTEYARASLIAHGRQRRHRRRIAAGAQVTVLVAAVVAVVVVVGASGGRGHASGPATVPIQAAQAPKARRTHHAVASPLVTLAARVRALPSTTVVGDATLVERDTLYNGHARPGYGGFDLYLDSGRYVWSPGPLSTLPEAVATGENWDAPGQDNEAQVEAKLAAVAGGTPAQARAAALQTMPDDSGSVPSVAVQHRRWAAQPAVIKDRYPFQPYTARSWRSSQDNDVYTVVDQVLQVAVGRPDVRAVAIKALSTMQGVVARAVTLRGVPAVKFDYVALGETLWLNARTGVPIQENDGGGSVTRYLIERVTAAHLPTTMTTNAQAR